MLSQANWYQAEHDDQSLDPIREAFAEAKTIFSTTITKDSRKIKTVSEATCLEDVRRAALDAKSHYDTAHKEKKVGRWLASFSSRICYYGNIMDVLVQHHPEYVSLAWGAMKFLFVLVENHEAMTKHLAKSLCQIAGSLPRTELGAILYPTRRMKSAVAELYARIIRFLIRARDWLQENKALHLLHSITRPVELRYTDIMEEMEVCAKIVDSLACAGAQAEQRDMHLLLEDLMKRQRIADNVLSEVRQLMITHQTINSSSDLDTNRRLTDLQLSQIMDYTSGTHQLDSLKSLQYCAFISNRYFQRSLIPPRPFWLDPKFEAWKTQNSSSIVIVKGGYSARFDITKFCVDAVNLLRDSKIPVVWTVKTADNDSPRAPGEVDILKNLVSQALRLNISLQNERALSLSCARFRGAETAGEWLDLLGSVFAGLPQVYVIIDTESVGTCYEPLEPRVLCSSGFNALFGKMVERGCKTVVKVILLSYGSVLSLNESPNGLDQSVIGLAGPQKALIVPKDKFRVVRTQVVSSRSGYVSDRHRRGLVL